MLFIFFLDEWPIVNVIDYAKILYPPGFLFRFNKNSINNSAVTMETPVNENLKTEKNCGTLKISNLSIFYLNENGDKTYPGQWPWLTAIFVRLQNKFEFKCTGSLLTQKHVITGISIPIKLFVIIILLKLTFIISERIYY